MVLRHTPLVHPDRLTSPESYRQLSRRGEDEQFRSTLERLIGDENFASLRRSLSSEGAVSVTGVLPSAQFELFRRTYDAEMKAKGSRGSLHGYLNVASSIPLLGSPSLWETVAHPLFVVVIAHALGGPVKLVDLRAKDTYPVDVVARDNTLHLDNSPFIDEYKVVVTWSLGSVKGPSGQGLTYLPRTNRLFRQCFVDSDGNVWSDEDACIFPSETRVDEALSAQALFLEEACPLVVDLTDLEAPCHTIFAASRLIHHRYRTSIGAGRSAVMASFHRTDDSPEQFTSQESCPSPLGQFIVTGGSREQFLTSVRHEMPRIARALNRMAEQPGFVVDPQHHTLAGRTLDEWYARQCEGVTLNKLRAQRMAQDLVQGTSAVERLVRRLQHDVQGPLNMPFFADMRETRRKRARIWLREMPPEGISEVVEMEWLRLRRNLTTEGPAGSPIADLLACLRDLDRLLTKSQAPTDRTEHSGSTVEEAIWSLPSFIKDLTITASWLAEDDTDSVITATAFAFLASSLSFRWFTLENTGKCITRRLFQLYLDLVHDVPDLQV
jgi:hypothetical protein